jgi:hypothetical protein
MAIANKVMLYVGSIALLGAFGFISWTTYLWILTPCNGDAECMGSTVTFVLFAFALSVVGAILITAGRSYDQNSN